ncbi:MAG: divergent PAP2 family protein [Oscillospiraceae bacterium]|nr:divergent PAP2 family protein [Oscillospiraceae bacterium]
MDFSVPLANQVLVLSALSWAVAQFVKGLVIRIMTGRLTLEQFFASGGMPSSHSALVTCCATTVGTLYGFDSGLFALAALFAMVVMYDACHVRLSSGEQAKVVNELLRSYHKDSPNELLQAELKVVLGHTTLQVVMGAVLGLIIALVGMWLMD